MLRNLGRPHTTEISSCKPRLIPRLLSAQNFSRLERSSHICPIDIVLRSGRQSTTENMYKCGSHRQSFGEDPPGLRVS